MKQYFEIVDVLARKIYDFSGNEAIEVEVTVDDGTVGRASVASSFDDVSIESENVNTEIEEALLGMNALDQASLDGMLIELDGTEDVTRLGKGAVLGASLACAKAAAKASGLSLYNYIGGVSARLIPAVLTDPSECGSDTAIIRLSDYATLTELLDAAANARRTGLEPVPASGDRETGESILADISVALNAEKILLTGADTPIRNELIRIEEELFDAAVHPE